jgi:hypothetical protein
MNNSAQGPIIKYDDYYTNLYKIINNILVMQDVIAIVGVDNNFILT